MHPRPHWLWTWFGGAALLGCATAWLSVLLQAISSAPTLWAGGVGGLVAALAGWLLADLVSGMVHLAADRLGDEHTPLVGRNVIAPFREHHVDPSAMTEHGVVEINGDCALAVLPMLLAGVWLLPSTPTAFVFALHVALLSFSAAVLLTNQIHQWAHAPRAPRAIRWLQRRGLILSPEHHVDHHRQYDRAYCITAGWCDVLLDRMLASRRQPGA